MTSWNCYQKQFCKLLSIHCFWFDWTCHIHVCKCVYIHTYMNLANKPWNTCSRVVACNFEIRTKCSNHREIMFKPILTSSLAKDNKVVDVRQCDATFCILWLSVFVWMFIWYITCNNVALWFVINVRIKKIGKATLLQLLEHVYKNSKPQYTNDIALDSFRSAKACQPLSSFYAISG